MFPTSVLATVEFLMVNHITKEICWSESSQIDGVIGWENIPEGRWGTAEKDYLELGYSFTSVSYKIEVVLCLLFLTLLMFLFFTNRRKRSVG